MYTVVASDARGCTSQDTLAVTAIPDPLPPPVDASLRVTKSGARGVLLTWADIPAVTVGGYQAVFLECTDRAWRTSCAGRSPDPATIQASPLVGPAVAAGVQAMVQPDALDRGRLIFYKVRGLSPCSLRHGPTCHGFPHPLPPCTPP